MNMKIPFPFRIILNMTNRCNSDCLYCSNKEFSSDDLSYDEWVNFINVLSDKKIASVILSGGEPLLYPNIYEIINLLHQHKIRVNIISNGILVNQMPEDIMHKITSFQISFDGKEYNSIYRRISPNIPLEAMKTLSEANIKTYSMTVVTKANIDDMEKIYLEVCDRTDLCCFERVSIVGNARQHKDMQLTPDDEKKFVNTIHYLQTKYGETILCNDPIQNCSKLARDCLAGCAIGLSTLCISNNGDILPCTRLPIVLGNIKQNDISDVWDNSKLLNDIRCRNLQGKCQSCEFKFNCGGCRAAAWAKTGNCLDEDPECYIT